MAEYIEKKTAVEFFETLQNGTLKDGNTAAAAVWKLAAGIVKHLPKAEVVPVVHGRWEPAESDFDDVDALFDVEDWCDWQCSVCHEDICYDDPMEQRWLPKYCPNCGAKMDGGDENAAD